MLATFPNEMLANRQKRPRDIIEVPCVSMEHALAELPDELLEMIVLRLPVAAVVALGSCCARLHRIAASAWALFEALGDADRAAFFHRLSNALPPAKIDQATTAGKTPLDRLPDQLLEPIVHCLPVAAVVALGSCSVRLQMK
eukprot:TRINITY_DN4102_c0_g1_i1.p2 TRINITY_DN4102_c0_g1~~TRINITY_DN4102_c0_g1_i1.p2  ORF type:complete len:142 (+),score=35.92 TRINITY_DN4102_c0_g1_i1:259-684(+)